LADELTAASARPNDASVQLADGRALAYAEFGRPDGVPVLGFHGTPNSRLVHLGDDQPRAAGARLILVDRPGFGRSDAQPGRAVLDWPRDIEFLADALGIERFAVFGISGGGAYATACGYAMGDRVSAVGLVSSVGPIADLEAREARAAGPAAAYRHELDRLARHDPAAARDRLVHSCTAEFEQVLADADRWLDDWAATAPSADRELTADPAIRAMYIDSVLEAARRGPDAYAHELSLLWLEPWGFALEYLRVPVWIWHGSADASVPLAVAESLAARIPGARLEVFDGGGHMAVHTHAATILSALVGSGDPLGSPSQASGKG
jgi:pimeloyl-ACP methyl ester carboxylesterase